MAGIILSLQLRLMRSRVAAFRNDSRRVQTAVVAALVLGYLIYRYGGPSTRVWPGPALCPNRARCSRN